MRRVAFLVLPLITLFPISASALTVRDVVELSRAGLGEDVILALIEVEPSVFPIDTATLKMLKEAGVSQRVIVAMVRSGHTQPLPSAELVTPVVEQLPPAEPQVVVIDHHDAPVVREVPVAVPVYVPVLVSNRRARIDQHGSSAPDPVDAALRQQVRDGRESEHTRSSQPAYWGFGGQLRPDAWGPRPAAPTATPAPVKKEKEKDR